MATTCAPPATGIPGSPSTCGRRAGGLPPAPRAQRSRRATTPADESRSHRRPPVLDDAVTPTGPPRFLTRTETQASWAERVTRRTKRTAPLGVEHRDGALVQRRRHHRGTPEAPLRLDARDVVRAVRHAGRAERAAVESAALHGSVGAVRDVRLREHERDVLRRGARREHFRRTAREPVDRERVAGARGHPHVRAVGGEHDVVGRERRRDQAREHRLARIGQVEHGDVLRRGAERRPQRLPVGRDVPRRPRNTRPVHDRCPVEVDRDDLAALRVADVGDRLARVHCGVPRLREPSQRCPDGQGGRVDDRDDAARDVGHDDLPERRSSRRCAARARCECASRLVRRRPRAQRRATRDRP